MTVLGSASVECLQVREVMGFLVKQGKVLLGRRMTGRAVGAVSGFGGRLLECETSQQGIVREVREECGIQCLAVHPLARLRIIGVDDNLVHEASYAADIFWCSQFRGNPVATDEMLPFWCPIERVPYDGMWDSDFQWLPLALHGYHCDIRIVRHFETNVTFSCSLKVGMFDKCLRRALHGKEDVA